MRLLGGDGGSGDNLQVDANSGVPPRHHTHLGLRDRASAFLRGERMETPDALDESGKNLPGR